VASRETLPFVFSPTTTTTNKQQQQQQQHQAMGILFGRRFFIHTFVFEKKRDSYLQI
jgi:hypothetical protein